jgi:hypothetical protein
LMDTTENRRGSENEPLSSPRSPEQKGTGGGLGLSTSVRKGRRRVSVLANLIEKKVERGGARTVHFGLKPEPRMQAQVPSILATRLAVASAIKLFEEWCKRNEKKRLDGARRDAASPSVGLRHAMDLCLSGGALYAMDLCSSGGTPLPRKHGFSVLEDHHNGAGALFQAAPLARAPSPCALDGFPGMDCRFVALPLPGDARSDSGDDDRQALSGSGHAAGGPKAPNSEGQGASSPDVDDAQPEGVGPIVVVPVASRALAPPSDKSSSPAMRFPFLGLALAVGLGCYGLGLPWYVALSAFALLAVGSSWVGSRSCGVAAGGTAGPGAATTAEELDDGPISGQPTKGPNSKPSLPAASDMGLSSGMTPSHLASLS